MNIFEALRESHDQQRHLSEQLVQTSGDSDERQQLFDALKMNCMHTRWQKTAICIFH